MVQRVFLMVLDSCGIGEMPDAAEFSDHDCNTLRRIAGSPAFSAETMLSLELGNIDGIDFLPQCEAPHGAVARMTERSKGKDTVIGHWEIAGLISNLPLPTFPDGFPEEVIEPFCRETGRDILCNKAYSGTEVIRDYGEEHMKTGKLIVYTSADSVFQIAAHERVVPVEMLYEYCRIARRIFCGKYGVGRVIARPFTGEAPDFVRTAARRDFSLKPPGRTLLDALVEHGKTVLAVGKIYDIFDGRGITGCIPAHSNREGMEAALAAQDREFRGLCFINFVDFDMLYGHRQDVKGYAAAFAEFDRWLPQFLSRMRKNDLLIITADHGCDPGDDSTDHSREYTPLMIVGDSVAPVNMGTRESFADIAATVADALGISYFGAGNSMWQSLCKE